MGPRSKASPVPWLVNRTNTRPPKDISGGRTRNRLPRTSRWISNTTPPGFRVSLPVSRLGIVLGLLALSCSISSAIAEGWRFLGLSGHRITTIAVDPRNPDVMYAGGSGDFSAGVPGAVFKSSTGGSSWDTLLQGYAVNEIVLHPWDPDTVYVVLGTSLFAPAGLLKSSDGGASWVWSDSGIIFGPDRGLFSFAINPVDPNVMFAGTGGFQGGSFYKSTDYGSSWFWPESEIPGTTIGSIDIDPQHPETLYVGISSYASVWRSHDGGSHWDSTLLTFNRLADLVIDPVNTNRLHALLGGDWHRMIANSTDGGETWTQTNVADSTFPWGWSLAVNPAMPNQLFATAGNDSNAEVFQSQDYGHTWTLFNEGLAGSLPYTLFVDPTSNRVLVGALAIDEAAGGVYVRDIVSSIEDKGPDLMDPLLQCYPNPFNTSLRIRYSISRRQHIALGLWDILGREAMPLASGMKDGGDYEVPVDAGSLASGIYFVRLHTSDGTFAVKVLLMR